MNKVVSFAKKRKSNLTWNEIEEMSAEHHLLMNKEAAKTGKDMPTSDWLNEVFAESIEKNFSVVIDFLNSLNQANPSEKTDAIFRTPETIAALRDHIALHYARSPVCVRAAWRALSKEAAIARGGAYPIKCYDTTSDLTRRNDLIAALDAAQHQPNNQDLKARAQELFHAWKIFEEYMDIRSKINSFRSRSFCKFDENLGFASHPASFVTDKDLCEELKRFLAVKLSDHLNKKYPLKAKLGWNEGEALSIMDGFIIGPLSSDVMLAYSNAEPQTNLDFCDWAARSRLYDILALHMGFGDMVGRSKSYLQKIYEAAFLPNFTINQS